jgi:uncharacterized protein YbjQ (UPF0145 family)
VRVGSGTGRTGLKATGQFEDATGAGAQTAWGRSNLESISTMVLTGWSLVAQLGAFQTLWRVVRRAWESGNLGLLVGTVAVVLLLVLLVIWLLRQPRRNASRLRHQLDVELRRTFVTTSKRFPGRVPGSRPPVLVSGDAVVCANDLIRRLVSLRELLGGELRTYTLLSDWAAHLALLRVLQQARALGFNAVCNLRLETSDVGAVDQRRARRVMVAFFAYGTAYDAALSSASGSGL